MELHWEDGFEITVRIENGAAVVSANAAGLRSLAGHLNALAQAPSGSHLHLDAYNALEDGSDELILVRAEEPHPGA